MVLRTGAIKTNESFLGQLTDHEPLDYFFNFVHT